MCVCLYTCIYICVYIYVCVYICIYIYIYIIYMIYTHNKKHISLHGAAAARGHGLQRPMAHGPARARPHVGIYGSYCMYIYIYTGVYVGILWACRVFVRRNESFFVVFWFLSTVFRNCCGVLLYFCDFVSILVPKGPRPVAPYPLD